MQDETIFIIFAELKRFNKSEKECVTPQDKLLYLFKNIGKLENDANWDKDRFWQRFFKACEIAAFDEKKRAQYEQDMYDERRFQGQLSASYKNGLAEGREAGLSEGLEKGREEGREAGLSEGLKKGREEGLSEGREEGLSEGLEKGREEERLENEKRLIASAKKMVASGVDIDLVCSSLGVDKAMVQEK